ncbi:hypothetical protein GCM10020295_34260 [Streptomyces cinereospinus]
MGLLALFRVGDLLDAGQQRAEGVLTDRAAGLGQGAVAAGFGRRGRRAGAALVGVVRGAAVVRAAGAAGEQGREERGDAGYVRLPLHGQAPLAG